jgi:leucyl/phenylalanyl-tRNA--protein transferase
MRLPAAVPVPAYFNLPQPSMPVYALTDNLVFPPSHLATREGLLAIGGDLSSKRLLLAYSMGIFPWYSEGDPILWWSPDPRMVLYPAALRISRSLRRLMRKDVFRITIDRAFEKVIQECASVRTENDEGTWIVREMIEAYCRLHREGFAHSVEVWQNGELAGGLYGLSLGKCFFGESMFQRTSNASKVALVALVHHLAGMNCHFIDCQMTTAHLLRLGACEIPRRRYLLELRRALAGATIRGRWLASLERPSMLLEVAG